mmetsp:Transcript_34397/g.89002  ORF Transcript_34397/g.89002 Transcript_34397/m.89002 type:complete len:103 (+) Transcript_34397:730-1038(+)
MGGVGAIAPITKEMFTTLYAVQRQLSVLPQFAGVSARDYRRFRSGARTSQRHSAQQILDGQLLWSFARLSAPKREKICQGAEVDAAEVLKTLRQLEKAWRVF